MGITNSLRGDEHTFWEGPSYWMSVFLTYGLNGGQDPGLRIIAKPVLVWFFAPMVVLILGFTLFVLADSGFFRNGAFPVDELDFAQSHKFFSMDGYIILTNLVKRIFQVTLYIIQADQNHCEKDWHDVNQPYG